MGKDQKRKYKSAFHRDIYFLSLAKSLCYTLSSTPLDPDPSKNIITHQTILYQLASLGEILYSHNDGGVGTNSKITKESRDALDAKISATQPNKFHDLLGEQVRNKMIHSGPSISAIESEYFRHFIADIADYSYLSSIINNVIIDLATKRLREFLNDCISSVSELNPIMNKIKDSVFHLTKHFPEKKEILNSVSAEAHKIRETIKTSPTLKIDTAALSAKIETLCNTLETTKITIGATIDGEKLFKNIRSFLSSDTEEEDLSIHDIIAQPLHTPSPEANITKPSSKTCSYRWQTISIRRTLEEELTYEDVNQKFFRIAGQARIASVHSLQESTAEDLRPSLIESQQRFLASVESDSRTAPKASIKKRILEEVEGDISTPIVKKSVTIEIA